MMVIAWLTCGLAASVFAAIDGIMFPVEDDLRQKEYRWIFICLCVFVFLLGPYGLFLSLLAFGMSEESDGCGW